MHPNEWKKNTLHRLLDGTCTDDPDKSVVLLASDVNQAQQFVFESSRLPDIRGASRALATLNEPASARMTAPHITTLDNLLADEFNLHMQKGDIIYMGGGGLLALVKTKDIADEMKKRIQWLYAGQLDVVTASVVHQTFSAADIATDFGRCVRTLQMKLNIEKRSRTHQPFFERLPFMRVCQSCLTRPAVQLDPSPDIDEHPLCHICLKKVQHANESGWGGRTRSFWLERFTDDDTLDPPKDLQELGGLSDNEIGFLYADGDGVGQWLFDASSPQEYRKRSDKLSKAVNHALQSVVHNLPDAQITRSSDQAEENVFIKPVEIITVGGDDVLLILPANQAVAAAHRLSEQFAAAMDHTISLSVGVAIGRASTPVQQLHDIAADLLKKSAKRERRDTGVDYAFIDFHDVTREGIPTPNIARYREYQQYKIQDAGDELRLTMRPFAADSLQNLLDITPDLALPETQLHQLADTLYEGRERSELYYLYQCSRMQDRNKEAYAQLQELESRFKDADGFPWIPHPGDQNCYVSPLRDIALLKRITRQPQEDN